MFTRLLKLPIQIGESALSIVGVRTGTEEPPHGVEKLGNGVEIRTYEARIAAETTVTAGEEAARNAGFRRLAGYIFGANHEKTKIAMTAPVAQQTSKGTNIAMTAPVAQSAGSDGDWVIRFYMPGKWTMDRLPTPDDDRVRLVKVPPETVAVLRFSGSRDPQAVASHLAQLRNTLCAYGFEESGEPIAWFYDPPWTLPLLRRNEVAIPVSAVSPGSPPTA
ncbi:MAG TPA: heme-binding protein [Mycobacterium sp.]|nr:heme-binding protein [Mycobacterium sp.]